MSSEPSSLLDFPCAFPIKAMGRNSSNFEQTVREIVLRHAGPVDEEAIVSRPSGAGNFLSVTITITARSRQQLDSIYHDLTDCEQVLMAL